MSSGQNGKPTPNGKPEYGTETLLSDLLKVQEVAWSGGQPISIEQLLTQLPKTGLQTEATLDLVSNEVALRKFAGELPQLSDYQQRFPEAAEALQVQWEIDRLVDEGVELDAEAAQSLDRIGRYQIQAEVGRGAMGVVYRAWDPILKRVVAIKRLRAGFDATAIELLRIRTEAEAVARIHHDCVVQIHDIGENQGIPFLAMEYCFGGSLATRLQSHTMSIKAAAELMIKISEGVAAAHAANVLHRDLKPANVLLKEENSWHPKVSDFGLAKQTDGEDQATASGSLLGSPAYMAPEQAFGRSDQIGRAADVYALGAILYECLTGRPPFRGISVADTLEQVKNREPVAVRQLNPQVPLDLETITHKCLRKEPNQRYASASDLALDLGRFLKREPIQARRETTLQAIQRTFRRYPMASFLAITTLGLLLLITVGSVVAARQFNTQRLEAELAKREARLAQANSLIGRAEGIRRSRRPGQRFEALKAIREAVAIGRDLKQPEEWFAKLRGEAISAICLPDAYLEEVRQEEADIESAVFSDDRQSYAIAVKDRPVQIRDAQTHAVIAQIDRADQQATCFFVGNNHLMLGFSPSEKFELWSLESQTPRRLWQNQGGCKNWFSQTSFTPDRKRMAVANDREFRVIELDSGKILASHNISPFTRDATIAIHPNQPILAIASYFHPDKFQVRNWETGKLVFEPTVKAGEKPRYGRVTSVDWSRDGRVLVCLNDEGFGRFEFEPDKLILFPLSTMLSEPASYGGGNSLIRFNRENDSLLGWGWGSYLSLIDYPSGRLLMKSETAFRASPEWNLVGSNAGLCQRNGQLLKMSLASGREFQPFRFALKDHCRSDLGFDAAGNFLVAWNDQKLTVLNAKTLENLAELHLPGVDRGSIMLTDHEIIGASSESQLGWPYRIHDRNGSLHMEIGLPRRVHLPGFGLAQLSASRDGEVLAAGVWNGWNGRAYTGGWLKTADEPAARKLFGDDSGVQPAVSPDGRFAIVSSGNAAANASLVVDCAAESVQVQPIRPVILPQFSRSGQWWINGKERLPKGNWTNESVKKRSGIVVDISADGRFLLEQDPKGAIQIFDAELEQQVAYFELSAPIIHARFTPQMDRIFCDIENEGTAVIDLRLVQDQLQELGLQWQHPVFSQQQQPLHLEASFSKEVTSIQSFDDLLDRIDQAALHQAREKPTDGFAAFDAAMAAIRNRHMKQALEMLDRAVECLPESITSRQWRAYTRVFQRDYRGAIEDANWVLSRVEDGDLQLQRAEWLFRTENHDAAIADCTAVIQARPILAQFVYGLRGQIYRTMGNDAAADRDHQEFLQMTRNDAASLDRAIAPYVEDDLSLRRAVISLLLAEKMLSLTEELNAGQLRSIAMAHYRNDQFEQAINYFEQCLTQLTESDEDQDIRSLSLLGLAMAQHQSGKTELGRQNLERAMQSKHRISDSPSLVKEKMHILGAEAIELMNR